MKGKQNALEKRLFAVAEPDLAWGALIASGVESQRGLESYLAEIDRLARHIAIDLPRTDDGENAKALFDWLWRSKPDRYEYRGRFRLTEVLDAQLHPSARGVGNCLGLTVLYNVLAQRLGLDVHAVYLEEAHGSESHVFSLLYHGGRPIDIDNIFPHGFDIRDHVDDPLRIVWGNSELIADIYHSIGWALHEGNELEGAIQSYSKAIRLNPGYEKAHLNRGIALSMLGREDEARGDFEVSVE